MENPYCKYNAKAWMDGNEISEAQRKEMFPGITSDACANIQGGIAKSGNYDQITYDNQIQSYIAESGLPCWFYPYLFQEEKMEELTGEHDALYLEFSHHGTLPGPAEISTYVGNEFDNGDVVYLYYYNEETGKIETVNGGNGLTVSNGYVTFTLKHCSVYFLSEKTPAEYGFDVTPETNVPTLKPTWDGQNMPGFRGSFRSGLGRDMTFS